MTITVKDAIVSFIRDASAEERKWLMAAILQAQKQHDQAVARQLSPGDRVQFQAVGLVSAIDAELGRVVIRAAGRTFELPASAVQKNAGAPVYEVFEDAAVWQHRDDENDDGVKELCTEEDDDWRERVRRW